MNGGIGLRKGINDGLHDQQSANVHLECGRTQGILRSDNEDTLNALLRATTSKIGFTAVRQYSRQNEYIEHFSDKYAPSKHKLKATMSAKHCLLAWTARHAVNRYIFTPTDTQALPGAGDSTSRHNKAHARQGLFVDYNQAASTT